MNLPYATLQDAVQDIRSRRFTDLKCLPYNRFDAEQSGWWWLLNSNDRAAFHLPKLVLCELRLPDLEGKTLCGLHAEKGVVPPASENPHQHMNDNWFWHDLARRVRNFLQDDFARCRSVLGADGELRIVVQCGPVKTPNAWESVVFSYKGDCSIEAMTPAKSQLKVLSESSDLNSLASALENLTTEQPWFWVNCLLGATFSRLPDGEDDTARCTEMLAVFYEWLE